MILNLDFDLPGRTSPRTSKEPVCWNDFTLWDTATGYPDVGRGKKSYTRDLFRQLVSKSKLSDNSLYTFFLWQVRAKLTRPLRMFFFAPSLGQNVLIITILTRAGEPEPLETKPGAGAAKKLAGPSALREYKRIRKLYFSYSSLGKIHKQ